MPIIAAFPRTQVRQKSRCGTVNLTAGSLNNFSILIVGESMHNQSAHLTQHAFCDVTWPLRCKADVQSVYATVPTAAVLGKFTVKSVDSRELAELWHGTRKVAAVSSSEFDTYFDGLDRGVGIWIANTQRYTSSVSLTELLDSIPGFHPPQGFRYLSDDEVKVVENLAKGRKKKNTLNRTLTRSG